MERSLRRAQFSPRWKAGREPEAEKRPQEEAGARGTSGSSPGASAYLGQTRRPRRWTLGPAGSRQLSLPARPPAGPGTRPRTTEERAPRPQVRTKPGKGPRARWPACQGTGGRRRRHFRRRLHFRVAACRLLAWHRLLRSLYSERTDGWRRDPWATTGAGACLNPSPTLFSFACSLH